MMIKAIFPGVLVAGLATTGVAQDQPDASQWMRPVIAAWLQHDPVPPGLEQVWVDPDLLQFTIHERTHPPVWPRVQLEAMPEIKKGTWRIAPPDCLTHVTSLLECGLGRHDAALSFGQPKVRGDSLEVMFRAYWYILGRLDRLDGGMYVAILLRDGSSWRLEKLRRHGVV
jgi:hypothetical protein